MEDHVIDACDYVTWDDIILCDALYDHGHMPLLCPGDKRNRKEKEKEKSKKIDKKKRSSK